MLRLERVAVQAGSFRLADISLEVTEGAYAILMGANGSGKSTLLEAICGLRPLAAGRVLLQGREVGGLPPRARGIGYVPQDLALFPTMSVREHLGFALAIRAAPAAAIRQRVGELAALLGLEGLLERRPLMLSGGEKQRVALGRALAAAPRVLLLDEPFSASDEGARERMYDLLRAVRAATAATILHVCHSSAEALALGDLVFRLEAGVIRPAAGPDAAAPVARIAP